jgi:hypothetical protein
MKEKLRIRIARWLVSSASHQEDDGNHYISTDYSMQKNSVAISGRGLQPSQILNGDRQQVNFTVHTASGGYVVESSFYDEKHDRHNRNLTIITSQEDFSEELGKAVFIDLMRNR